MCRWRCRCLASQSMYICMYVNSAAIGADNVKRIDENCSGSNNSCVCCTEFNELRNRNNNNYNNPTTTAAEARSTVRERR
ncbi:uncharacterized protein LOC26527276 isoform X1 [Drosophila mojavensis]|nr:uncharacterized protein LOC26527276 isoform X1 [Drosophila mojavensis]